MSYTESFKINDSHLNLYLENILCSKPRNILVKDEIKLKTNLQSKYEPISSNY